MSCSPALPFLRQPCHTLSNDLRPHKLRLGSLQVEATTPHEPRKKLGIIRIEPTEDALDACVRYHGSEYVIAHLSKVREMLVSQNQKQSEFSAFVEHPSYIRR